MEPVVFKRWNNKGWSVFASLQRVIIIATLSVSYQMLAQESPGHPQDSAGIMMLELEEVETSAPWPAELDEAGLRPLVQITLSDIEAAPAAGNHEEILEALPDVDIRQRGKHGTQADLSIRGGSFDQGMVLLNGINLSDPQTGHFALNLPLPLQSTSGMEVLTGSATRIHGIHAFSGAVNILSSPSDSTRFEAALQGGQYGLYKGHALVNLAGRSTRAQLSGGSSGSRGYRPNTDFRNHHAYLHLQSGVGPWEGHLMLGLNRRKFGANAFYTPRFPDQYEETLTGLAALKVIRREGPGRWTFKLYSRLNRDHFLLDRQDPSFYQNDHLSQAAGAELNYRRSWAAGISQAGLSYRNEGIRSTSLGEELEESKNAWLDDSLEYSHGISRNILGWNMNHSWEAGPLRLSAGFLLSVPEPGAGNAGLYPGMDLRLALAREVYAFASVNRSMRLPTFTDLYYQGPSNQGNPDLVAEKALNLEAGLYRHSGAWYMEVQGWYRQGRELIDWVWMEDERWHTLNFSRINAMGGGLQLRYSPQHRGSIRIEYASLAYSLGHQLKLEEEYVSRYLLDYLRHKAILSARLGLGRHFGLSLQGMFQERKGAFLAFDPESGESSEQDYDPFLLVDVRLDYSLKRISIFAEASNLLNASYYDIGNVVQPGRWMSVGIRIH